MFSTEGSRPVGVSFSLVYMFPPKSIQESPFLDLEAVYVLECSVGVREALPKLQSPRRCALPEKGVSFIIFFHFSFRVQASLRICGGLMPANV